MHVKKLVLVLLIVAIVVSRFVGLNWGLPYSMHPDERNMSNAIQNLGCKVMKNELRVTSLKNCLNPQFFAYGQLPLYVGYGGVMFSRLVTLRSLSPSISFDEATIALRLISAISSLATIFVLYRIVGNLLWKKRKQSYFQECAVILTISFVPWAIQLSHFGTTESLLMMLFSLILYFSLAISDEKNNTRNYILCGLLCGISIGVKLSSIVVFVLPLLAMLISTLSSYKKQRIHPYFAILRIFMIMIIFLVVGYFLSSPYNVISFSDFINSMQYESAVALGKIEVFYTRQFFASIPYYFQLVRVFPYALGTPMFIFFVLSLFTLPVNSLKWWIIRLAFVVPFITSGFMFAKWSRFMALTFPPATLIIALGVGFYVEYIERNKKLVVKLVGFLIVVSLILPGLSYISIYSQQDVRFAATERIKKIIPSGSMILSETANVVDIPFNAPYKNYNVISFDFYNLDTDLKLQNDLNNNLRSADYIFVPSRRIFANHTCYWPSGNKHLRTFIDYFAYKSSRCKDLIRKYPHLNEYYRNLFDVTKYHLIAEISSYPKISLFGQTLIEHSDEASEETWTVFDHPVVRIYKKI